MNACIENLEETKTMRYTFFPSFLFAIIFASITISAFGKNPFFKSTPAPEYRGNAADGLHEVATIEFPDLKDSNRNDRNVPIKIHVPKEKGPFPVVLVSHGGGGHWDANYAQARHLATRGYVAICLEHIGSNTAVLKKSFRMRKNLQAMLRDSTEVIGRPKDVSFAIDKAEEWNRSHFQLKGKMNLEKIGVLGHSYGGYTTMAVCGMRPKLDDLSPKIETGLSENLRDPRVDCGVALSPQGLNSWAFNEESFKTLSVPLLGISGTRDTHKDGPAKDRLDGFKLWPKGDHHFVWIEGADHLAFSDNSGSTNRAMLPSTSRFDVQPISRAATLSFFNAHLKDDEKSLDSMTANFLKVHGRGQTKNVTVYSKIPRTPTFETNEFVSSPADYGSGWHKESLTHDDIQRHYRIFVPKGLKRNAPVVVLLHGGNQSMNKIFFDTAGATRQWPIISEREKFVLIAPNAMNLRTKTGKGDRQVWSDIRGMTKINGREVDDVGFIKNVIEKCHKELQTDRNKTYVTGASNGGMMTFRMLVEASELFAAGVAFIATIPEKSPHLKAPSSPVPLMIMNGTKDPLIKWDGGVIRKGTPVQRSTPETVKWWADANKADLSNPTEKSLPDVDLKDNCRIHEVKYSAKEGGAPVWLYRVEGAGHITPSLKHHIRENFMTRSMLGIPCKDSEGAELAWKFMTQFSKETRIE